jgi:hypothetical protein
VEDGGVAHRHHHAGEDDRPAVHGQLELERGVDGDGQRDDDEGPPPVGENQLARHADRAAPDGQTHSKTT